MIREVAGDILLTRAAAIAHGIAPGDHFDNGLALSLRERFPALAKDFRHFCAQKHPKPGTAWAWAGAGEGHGTMRIFNLLTQDAAPSANARPGKATLQHVGHALKALAETLIAEKITSVALPRLATGVGGLDWADVRPLIEKHLGGIGIPVIVYTTFHKGEAADERLA